MRELSEKGKIQLKMWEEENRLREGPCDKEYKSCVSNTTGDCRYLTAALSWWCVNEDAKAYRGTSIPGIYNCAFYEARPTKKKGSIRHVPVQETFCKLVIFLIFIGIAISLGFMFKNFW